ncbi:hypothetical protein AHAS_Ahas03G0192500 [Arachis hypogaea]
MEINPDIDMSEILSIFFKRYKDFLSNELVFSDFGGNEIEVAIEKGHCTAIIVNGYNSFTTLYGLGEGGWLRVCYVGMDKFLILEVRDHNMLEN